MIVENPEDKFGVDPDPSEAADDQNPRP